MTTARSELIDIEATPYYHCMARCVRRAFLYGDDKLTGRNFDHRKTWIVERIKFLASLFAIDVCAYAILANHVHLVLRVMAQRIGQWNDEEVLRRLGQLCPTCVEGIENWDDSKRKQLLETWRERLSNISWFMKLLDEYIARQANKEDGCTGRFWEGRFKSKALLDDAALLTSMAYVDLNPVRAGIATGLDDSSWTSIQQRLREVAASEAQSEGKGVGQPKVDASQNSSADTSPKPGADASQEPVLAQCPDLAPMEDDTPSGTGRSDSLPISLLQYIALLEWTGRVVRDDKRGFITAGPTELLSSFDLDPDLWLESVEQFGSLGGFVGHPSRLKERASKLGRRWLKGQGSSTLAYAM